MNSCAYACICIVCIHNEKKWRRSLVVVINLKIVHVKVFVTSLKSKVLQLESKHIDCCVNPDRNS